MNEMLEDLMGDDRFGDPDADPHEVRIPYYVPGIVKNREDPKGIGRIIATVDGLFEEGTRWLNPLSFGGGAPKRGEFNPPQNGAVVGIFFPLGLQEEGFYITAGYVKQEDVPGTGKVSGDKTRVSLEDDEWLIERDDGADGVQYIIKHKSSDTHIELLGEGRITINASVGKLGVNAAQSLVLGEKLDAYLKELNLKLNNHNHLAVGTEPGFTGPPALGSVKSVVFTDPSGILSGKWKVEE